MCVLVLPGQEEVLREVLQYAQSLEQGSVRPGSAEARLLSCWIILLPMCVGGTRVCNTKVVRRLLFCSLQRLFLSVHQMVMRAEVSEGFDEEMLQF